MSHNIAYLSPTSIKQSDDLKHMIFAVFHLVHNMSRFVFSFKVNIQSQKSCLQNQEKTDVNGNKVSQVTLHWNMSFQFVRSTQRNAATPLVDWCTILPDWLTGYSYHILALESGFETVLWMCQNVFFLPIFRLFFYLKCIHSWYNDMKRKTRFVSFPNSPPSAPTRCVPHLS